jgi:hypothetical protein
MLEFYSPLDLLTWLEANGYQLRIEDGKLYGPPGLQPEVVEQVKYHKSSLIALISYQCPICNQPIRDALKTENLLYIECCADPTHFGLQIPLKHGQPSFITSGGVKPSRCVQCDKPNDGEWKYCAVCWLALFEEDQANASESEQV